MTTEPAGYIALKAIHENSRLLQEGGQPVVLLEGFSFRTGDRTETMDVLLYPREHSGYPTRLFFARQISGKGANWGQHHVVGQSWWALSWNYVQASTPWPAMLCAHLRAVA